MTKAIIVPGDGDSRHGSVNGYSNLKCRCQDCRDAHAANMRRYLAHVRSRGIPAHIEHGTYNCYHTYGCRCDDCKAANARFSRGERMTKRRWST